MDSIVESDQERLPADVTSELTGHTALRVESHTGEALGTVALAECAASKVENVFQGITSFIGVVKEPQSSGQQRTRRSSLYAADTITVSDWVLLMRTTGPSDYRTDARAALALYHTINSSGSGAITYAEMQTAMHRVEDPTVLGWLLSLTAES